jgi:hypothetical protein
MGEAEMNEKFDGKEYRKFLKKAYSLSDRIAVDLDVVVGDRQRLSKGKYSFLEKHLVEAEIHYENHVPYSRLILERHYDVYHYLEQIESWEGFSAWDAEADLSIRCVRFMKDGKELAYMISHYRAYRSEFGWR